jgi:autotransporter translocation and assembly factor TamB
VIRRLVRGFLALVLAIFAITVCAWLWLWHTESGAQWAFGQARSQLASAPRAASLQGTVEGTLGREIRIRDLRYEDEAVIVLAKQARVRADFGLSPLSVTIAEAHLLVLEVTLLESQSEDGGLEEIDTLASPFPITVDQLDIQSAVVSRGDFMFPIDTLKARGKWFETFGLTVTELKSPDVDGSLELAAELEPPFELEAGFRAERYRTPTALRDRLPWLPPTLKSEGTVRGSMEALDLTGQAHWPEWLPEAQFEGRLEDPTGDLVWFLDLTVPRAVLPGQWLDEEMGGKAIVEAEELVLEQFSIHGEGDLERYSLNGLTALSAPSIQSDVIDFELAGTTERLERWRVYGEADVSA